MKGIQNLGKLDGMSYLDWFRKVITCLGNTLGFVRMIWTASMKDLTGTIKFIPKEAVFANYSEILKDLGIEESSELYKATKNFEDTIKLLIKKELEVKDYLRNLVSVFYRVFKGEQHKHMRLFYILIPTLSINFVDSIKAAKDKILKKR